ncbi:RNA polymerase III subunit GL b isoform X2 [Scophthalmus maximus]|uniref:RNA polymerase III subunit GL b isoform X2 n=1 Tax=Scophthalmus maximus TaxID=52904 RepID=UPI0015E08123|nr:RNA polymerase III subunit GL b isoform X2 [Scophthalmus maximus]
MAGRGGRTMSFSMDAVGINRGDSLPPSMQQPTPAFPAMEQKPLPLAGGEEAEYLLALKQEFRGAMRSRPCFIQPAAARRDVERYSDKYHSSEQTDTQLDWTPDLKRFPRELRVLVRKPHRDGVTVSRSVAPCDQKKKRVKEKEEVLLTLETLEKKEQQSSEEEEEEKKKQEEEEAEVEEEYEEEFEEETDYIMSYFDNGEDFGGDSDDPMDEAIY